MSHLRLRTLEPHNVSDVLDLWTQRWGRRFPLDRDLWRQNTEGDPRHFHRDRCWVIESGGDVAACLALKVPDDPPAWPGQDPKQGWMSFLLIKPGHEAALAPPLLDHAMGCLRTLGLTRMAYGGDPSSQASPKRTLRCVRRLPRQGLSRERWSMIWRAI